MSFRTIFLHGALGSAKQMQPLADFIEADAACLDLPGHGAKSSNGEPYSIEAMAENVLESLTKPVHLFGYSMGGYVALYLAAKHPEMVKSVTTLATKFDWTPEGAQQEIRMLNPDKVEEKVPAFAALLQQRHGDHWKDVMFRTADMMLALGNSPTLTAELLAAVKCPVLLLRGSEDAMVSKDETLWAQKHIPNARYVELEGQPHPLEKVDLTAVMESIQ
ncbi:MAG: alpha/beta fold hydrolase [Flavobacteriales bacterium]|nr:alpha/beta fold hydrolase [Flavobacteriales bacterium]